MASPCPPPPPPPVLPLFRVASGARFSKLSDAAPGVQAQKATYLFISPGLDTIQWSQEEPDADDRPATAGGKGWRESRSTGAKDAGWAPTARIRAVARGGWTSSGASSGGSPAGPGAGDPFSARNCAWYFETESQVVSLLAQDNAQREDWVTALTLISKAAARGMLPGPPKAAEPVPGLIRL